MMNTKTLLTTFAATAVFAAGSTQAAIFTDTFDSGTGDYYVDDTSVTFTTTPPLTNVGGAVSWSGNGNVIVGRSFTDQTLAVGETLRITADFTTSGSGIFRFGLYDFGTETAGADNWTVDNEGTAAGYYMFFRDNSTSESDHRYQTFSFSGTSTAEIMASENEDIGGTNTAYDFQSATTYSLLYEVTLTSAGQVDTLASVSLGGSPVMSSTGTTTTNVLNTFDTFVFWNNSGTLDNVNLELVPEPSSLALLGLGGLMIAARRRRD